jgi:hypothetical protein
MCWRSLSYKKLFKLTFTSFYFKLLIAMIFLNYDLHITLQAWAQLCCVPWLVNSSATGVLNFQFARSTTTQQGVSRRNSQGAKSIC